MLYEQRVALLPMGGCSMTNREENRRKAIARMNGITTAADVENLMPLDVFIEDGWTKCVGISPDPEDWMVADYPVAMAAWGAICRAYRSTLQEAWQSGDAVDVQAAMFTTYQGFRKAELDVELPTQDDAPNSAAAAIASPKEVA